MEELMEYLTRCKDNRFFSRNITASDIIENMWHTKGAEETEKICEQLNELLLKVKRGELGKAREESVR